MSRDPQKGEHYRKGFPSTYLRGADLPKEGATVTIEKVKIGVMIAAYGEEPKERVVVFFVKAKKPLVLNITNAKAIAKLYGGEMNEWIGKQVHLYAEWGKYFGEYQPAVRVKKP